MKIRSGKVFLWHCECALILEGTENPERHRERAHSAPSPAPQQRRLASCEIARLFVFLFSSWR